MPDHREFQNNAVSSSSSASPDNLEEAMWRLKVEDDSQEGLDGNQTPYPDRLGVPDCIHYLRTGVCGYGSSCRYNHPTNSAKGTPQQQGELPERVGQPDCQFFLKTGTCKFGATCKYHHPRDRFDGQPVPLNNLGFPLRQDEMSCPYYMRTGTCKFGIACKFNHPPPAAHGAIFPMTGTSNYGSLGSSGLSFYGGLSPWPLARPPYISSPRMQGLSAYMPVVLPPSQGTMPFQQSWSTYTGSLGHLPSPDGLGPIQIPNTKVHAQSGSQTAINLPERPDQPECQFYMKNGSCKYGASCKYHHPKETYSEGSFGPGPSGLPQRPGHAICTFYSTYGTCRYGSDCKFDHPLMGFYNYPVISDPSALSSRSSSQALWAPQTEATLHTSKFSNTETKMDSADGEHMNNLSTPDSQQNHTN